MQLDALKTRRYWVKTFFVLWILLLAGCSWLIGPSLEVVVEASKERRRIENFDNWEVVFDINTKGLINGPKNYMVEIKWKQTKENFYIQMKTKNDEILKDLTFYIEGKVDDAWVRGVVTETKQERRRYHGDDVDVLFRDKFFYSLVSLYHI